MGRLCSQLGYIYVLSFKLFKSLMWRNVVEKTYKHKPIYLIAKEEREVKGVLPLFLMRSLVFGNKLVSVPFALYGGVCADNETAERALVGEAKRFMLLPERRSCGFYFGN
jgi:hypothetical protein